MMKWFIVLAIFSVTVSCNDTGSSQEEPSTVLTVGSQTYSDKDFSRRLVEKAGNFDLTLLHDDAFFSRLKQEVLRELTIEGLLLLWEPHLAQPISENAIQSEISEKQAQYPSAKTYRRLLKATGIGKDDFQRRVRAQLIKEALVSGFKVTPKIDFTKTKQRYWSDKESFIETAKIKVQQIVAATEHEASTLIAALKKGADFGTLAKKYSIAEEASSGGRLGWIGKGVLPVFDAAFRMPLGRTSSVQKSPYGYHIIRVLEKKSRRKVPLDEVKEQMRQKSLQTQRSKLYKEWLESRLIAVPIKVNTAAVKSAEIQTKRNYE